jgi:hypothetical protein
MSAEDNAAYQANLKSLADVKKRRKDIDRDA